MNEALMTMIECKRAWTEAAKCAEKEGSIVAADYARAQAKAIAKEIVSKVADMAKGGEK